MPILGKPTSTSRVSIRESDGKICTMSNEQPAFVYEAVSIEQQPGAPEMYVLGVAADELLQWSDVPSAKADYMAGYQRAYNQERASSITEFLKLSPRNIIPGATIVTVNAENVEIERSNSSLAKVSVWMSDEKPLDESIRLLYNNFKTRLSESELDSIKVDDEGDDQEDEETGIPESYLASLTAELELAVQDFGALAPERKKAIANYVDSVSKPGLIIDGQHRVFGAKDDAQNSVVLPVVLLPGLDFAEQVFHFYVLNNKAKPLTPTELRRTISTSLTNKEIDLLWQRFEDAKVDPEATRWTHKLHTDIQSPFKGLIDFGLEGGGFLKENVAYQLVSKFVNMPKKYTLLFKGIESFDHKDDGRLQYFYTFWSAIKEKYEQVWESGVDAGGNQIFMKATLLVLQTYLLDQLVQYTVMRQVEGGGSPLGDPADLQKTVKGLLSFLPPEFFSEDWQAKQIDTSEGHKFLRSQMEMAVQGQGQNFRKQSLFKKTKSQ